MFVFFLIILQKKESAQFRERVLPRSDLIIEIDQEIPSLDFEGRVRLAYLAMSAKDFASLDGKEFIDDRVISFFLEWHKNRLPEEVKDSVAILGPSQVALLRNNLSPDEFLELILPFDLNRKRVILSVLNNPNDPAHWSLLIFADGSFYHLDSVRPWNSEIAQDFANYLGRALDIGDPSFEDKICSHQKNNHDCGLYVIENGRKSLEQIYVKSKCLADNFRVKVDPAFKRIELKEIVRQMVEQNNE